MTGSIQDINNNKIPFLLIKIERSSKITAGYGYANEEGIFSGKIPKDELLLLHVYDECGEIIYSSQIGPFSRNTTLEPIVLGNDEKIITISGNLLNCDNESVSHGYVVVYFNEFQVVIDVNEDGSFIQNVNICSSTRIKILAVDLDKNYLSEIQTYDINDHSVLNVVNLKACIEFEEYFSYTFSNGESYNLTFVNSTEVGLYYIYAGTDSLSANILQTYIIFAEYELGNQDLIYGIYLTDYSNSNSVYYCYGLQTCSYLKLTALGLINEPIIGNFSGTFINDEGDTLNATGEFRVLRKF